MSLDIVRIRKLSRSSYIAIPPEIMTRLRLNQGDFMVVRVVEGKMVLERVPVEQIAKLRAQDVEQSAV